MLNLKIITIRSRKLRTYRNIVISRST